MSEWHMPSWMHRVAFAWWNIVPHRWVPHREDISKRSLFNWCARCGGSYPSRR